MCGTRKNKLLHFIFLKSINAVILVGFVISLLLTGIVVLIFNAQNKLDNESILVIVNVFVVSLPLILFILCVVVSAIFSVSLSKKNVAVNKLSHFESLLDVDVLCLDKESITDKSLVIKKIIPLKTIATEQYIAQWLSNMLRATNDSGPVFDTLSKQYDLELTAGVISILPYNNEMKYSGASFKGGKTIVLGSPEFTPIKNKVGILKRCEEDINKGCQILVVAEGKEQIGDNGYPGELEAIALIILKDHIREGAFETFKWFKDSGADIKVVSSDNALVTSVLAAEAGVDGADKYISLQGIEIERMEDVVSQYTVFGDASSEQKATIISILKKRQQVVMMVGGDESSALSMEESNFSVATVDRDIGSQKAADVVLESSSFEPLPLVINSSKVFMNNIEIILSLSLIKMALVFISTLFFTLFSSNLKQCLFVLNHLLLWDLITNGVALFLLMFDKTSKKDNNALLKNALSNAVPAAILQIAGVLSVFLLYALQNNQLLSTGLYSIDNVAATCVLLISIFGIASLFNICAPLNKHRKIVVIVGAAINVLAIATVMVITYLSSNTEIPYLSMNAPAYFAVAIIAAIYSTIYLFIGRIIGIVKGDDLKYEN